MTWKLQYRHLVLALGVLAGAAMAGTLLLLLRSSQRGGESTALPSVSASSAGNDGDEVTVPRAPASSPGPRAISAEPFPEALSTERNEYKMMAILTTKVAALHRKLEHFSKFPSVQHATLLQIESILVIQESRGAALLPNNEGWSATPQGAASISRSDGRAVYYYPDEFPECASLKALPQGARVPEDLRSQVEFRAYEALAVLEEGTDQKEKR